MPVPDDGQLLTMMQIEVDDDRSIDIVLQIRVHCADDDIVYIAEAEVR